MTATPSPVPRAASATALTTFDEDIVERTVAGCSQRLGGPADVAICFVTPDFKSQLPEFLEIVQVYGRTPRVIGCSAQGFIGTGQEHEDVAGFSILLLSCGKVDVRFVQEQDDPARREGEEFDENEVWLSLFHPMRIAVDGWLEERWQPAAGLPALIGGVATGPFPRDEDAPVEIFLFDQTGEKSVAGMLVRLPGVRIEPLVSQGCRPIGRPEMITQADGNVVTGLGGESAYSALHSTVKALLEDGAEVKPGSIHVGLAAQEYLENYGSGDFLVRNLLGADSDSGAIAVGTHVEAGRTMQFQLRDSDAADEDLRRQCKAVSERAGDQPIAALVFSCLGRGQRFFGVPHHDAGVIGDHFHAVPTAGFFCGGEIGPVGVETFVHGYTASAALLYAP